MIGNLVRGVVVFVPFALAFPYMMSLGDNVFNFLLNNFTVDPLVAVFLTLFPFIIFISAMFSIAFKVVFQ